MTRESFGLDPVHDYDHPTWDVFIEGEEVENLREKYREEIQENEWNETLTTAANILGRCPPPEPGNGRVTGLALGKVQSGKTLSYTTLIALSIDNGYPVTIVLSGTKKPLLEQTVARLKKDVADGRTSVAQFSNPSTVNSDVIRSVVHSGRHALILVLKNRKRIDNVRNIFRDMQLGNKPVLIIDDEGDEASLNTQFRRGGQSSVYRSILSLREVLHNHAYIAYTATPQANLLIDSIDALSPDFGELVYPGKGYCGGSVFFGDNVENFVRNVTNDDAIASSGEITKSLELAVATFLVGAVIRHTREIDAFHSMLIHNSSRKAEHEQSHRAIMDIIIEWRTRLNLSSTDPARGDIIGIFRNAYNDLASTVNSPPSWEEVQEKLGDEIWQVQVWMVNSLPSAQDPMSTPFNLVNNIFVGGNMLGRGLTIRGLAVTYITRRARNETNADTLEQRARWFGYKKEYLDLCRIFLTQELSRNYEELLRHEDDFWDALDRNMRQGISIRDWPRMLRLDRDMGLFPTRRNVADYRSFRGSGWDVQTTLVMERELAGANVQSVRHFFERHKGTVRSFGSTEHTVIESCSIELIVSELLSNVKTNGTNWDNPYNKEYLTRLLISGRLGSMRVLFMSRGETRKRTVTQGRVNPMQGRNPNYEGDEYIHFDEPQLQVHIIAPEGEGIQPGTLTTAFALFIPKDDQRFDLTYVVRSSNDESD